MTAIILAAGRGGRLRGVAGDKPKCLIRIGDCTLLERQIRTLRACGVTQIAVAAGYGIQDVQRIGGPGIHIVHNEQYASTNSLYSLWLARTLMPGGCVILNGDVLFHPQLLVDLLTARYEDALLVSSRDGNEYSTEEMKVRIRAGRVAAISKTLTNADAENIGIAKFGAAGVAVLVDEMRRLVSSGGVNEWLPAAFAKFCHHRPLHVVDSRGFPWIEIDFPEDYWRACSDVLPAIDATEGDRQHQWQVAAGAFGRTRHHV